MSYYDDPNDEEMLHLKFYLECLHDCEDVRHKNQDAFQLTQLAEAQLAKLQNLQSPKSFHVSEQNEIQEVDEGNSNDSINYQEDEKPNEAPYIIRESVDSKPNDNSQSPEHVEELKVDSSISPKTITGKSFNQKSMISGITDGSIRYDLYGPDPFENL